MKYILLTTFIFCFASILKAQEKAAICDIKVEGTEYALHLVEVGDNLFRISQKYNSTVEDIWKANPSLIDNSIIPGQVIKVPKNSKSKLSMMNSVGNDTKQSNIISPKPDSKLDPKELVYHEVEKQQTLFSISRMYNITIEDIQAWNKLTGYDISIGQKLIVSAYGTIKVIDNTTSEVKSYIPSATPIKQNISVNANQDVLYEKYLSGKASGMKLTNQRGAAGKLVSNNPNAKDAYYALHKTAEVGSIIKVMNLMNKKYVFVKVLAPLPDIAENENFQIKISPAAASDIVLLDDKSFVEISFYQ